MSRSPCLPVRDGMRRCDACCPFVGALSCSRCASLAVAISARTGLLSHAKTFASFLVDLAAYYLGCGIASRAGSSAGARDVASWRHAEPQALTGVVRALRSRWDLLCAFSHSRRENFRDCAASKLGTKDDCLIPPLSLDFDGAAAGCFIFCVNPQNRDYAKGGNSDSKTEAESKR